MVLESLISPTRAKKEPWEMFFIGIFYSTVAMFLSLWVFKEEASLIMVFLTVLACVPLMYNTLKAEEKKERLKETRLLREHGKVISFFTFLFLGFLVSFSVWFIFLPPHLVDSLFSAQVQTINAINSQIKGSSINTGTVTSFVTTSVLFFKILSNNIKVFLFCIFFSFFYGAGAIFILTWNSTVIAAAVGNFVRSNLSTTFGISYFTVFSVGLFRYMTHGIFEILAYFVGGLAGGLISVAVIRHELGTPMFRKVIFDSFYLMIIAVSLLILAAVIEVFVTPALF